MDLIQLSELWLVAKEDEKIAAEHRRQLEDQMRKAMKLEESEEGTVSALVGRYKVKANCRINRKIDPEKFLLLANDAGVDVSTFTKWKCELVMSAWRKQDEAIQRALSSAITAEPGRPTFSIDVTE